jgi:peptide/nickel transport system substrate-binding protein
MKKKIIWIPVSCLMVLSLVIASCGPAEEEAEVEVGEEEAEVGEEEVEVGEEEAEEEAIVSPDVPKYGGTTTLTELLPASAFDPFAINHVMCGTVFITNEELVSGDLSKGPSGTGENEYFDGFAGQTKYVKGWLAESWDLPDDQTIIYNIRKGVYWWDKPPISGRELTADDVVWSLNTFFSSPMSHIYNLFGRVGMTPTSIKALDKYTVEIKLPPGMQGMWLVCIGANMYTFPENITELVDLNDWRNAIGTGPWVLTDLVPDTSSTYEKNPNYWQMDPNHPENRLPYPDRQNCLVIPDASTQMAAFRTGKLDRLATSWESAEQLLSENPELKYVKMQTAGVAIHLRVDKPELPFYDVRVRRALNMAVNKQELIDDYYEGNAVMLGYPIKTHKVWEPMYIPLEELPETAREIFEYNPTKAKALLTEAGYPNGFNMKVTTNSAWADFLSIIKEYLNAIDVDMEIDSMEGGTFMSFWVGRKHDEAIYATLKPEHPYMFYTEQITQWWDCSFWSDPRIDEAYVKVRQVLGIDDAEVIRIMRETTPIILESAWGIWLPTPYNYTLYWPWFKGWNGEFDICYNDQGRDRTFIWIDEELKRSMGY